MRSYEITWACCRRSYAVIVGSRHEEARAEKGKLKHRNQNNVLSTWRRNLRIIAISFIPSACFAAGWPVRLCDSEGSTHSDDASEPPDFLALVFIAEELGSSSVEAPVDLHSVRWRQAARRWCEHPLAACGRRRRKALITLLLQGCRCRVRLQGFQSGLLADRISALNPVTRAPRRGR